MNLEGILIARDMWCHNPNLKSWQIDEDKETYGLEFLEQIDGSSNGLLGFSQTAGIIMRGRFPKFPIQVSPTTQTIVGNLHCF